MINSKKHKKLTMATFAALALTGLIAQTAGATSYTFPNTASNADNNNNSAGIKILHNDEFNDSLEDAHIDASIPHLEYEEELERGSIERSLELEMDELHDADEIKVIEQNLAQNDSNSMTNFFSNDDYSTQDYQIDIFEYGDDFYYQHLLPPEVTPDVIPTVENPQKFNDYDFTKNLIEFELEIEGWVTVDPSTFNTNFEVLLYEVITDSNGYQTNQDTASLGSFSFDSKDDYDDIWKFEFEFEQYNDPNGPAFISQEVYAALSTGSLGIHIQRTGTGGDAAFYLGSSELELEQPMQPVPEPATMLLLGTGLIGLAGVRRRKQQK